VANVITDELELLGYECGDDDEGSDIQEALIQGMIDDESIYGEPAAIQLLCLLGIAADVFTSNGELDKRIKHLLKTNLLAPVEGG